MMYTNSMHRTQILLRRQQYEALMALGRSMDKGLAELIRLAVDKMLGEPSRKAPGIRLADIRALAKDPRGVAGRDHDALLYGKPR